MLEVDEERDLLELDEEELELDDDEDEDELIESVGDFRDGETGKDCTLPPFKSRPRRKDLDTLEGVGFGAVGTGFFSLVCGLATAAVVLAARW